MRTEYTVPVAQNSADQERMSRLKVEKNMHLRKAQGAYDKLKFFTRRAKENGKIGSY